MISLLMAAIVQCYVGSNAGAPEGAALHVLECDTETGAARLVESVTNCEGTTYFQIDREGKSLYSVVSEARDGRKLSAAVRFPIAADGRLGPLERLCDLPCEAPCHVSLTPDGKRIAFAAYLSATCGTVGIDGKGLKTYVFPDDAMGTNRNRQQKAYAHQTFSLPEGTLGVVDLGCDRIRFFDPATMKPSALPDIKFNEGEGPRHAIVSKDGKRLYVVNELASSVSSFETSKLPNLQTSEPPLSTLPADYNRWEPGGENLRTKAAAIKLTADGKILMVSNRGHDSIAFFEVGPSGRLTLRNIAPLCGSFPRDFELMPGEKFMVVGHKMSNEIQIYQFDRVALTLTPVGAPIPLWRPLCFKFSPAHSA